MPPEPGRGDAWALAVAFDAAALDATPARLALDGATEVEIGRGDKRSYRRVKSRWRIDLSDRIVSQVHARLVPAGEGWRVEDAGSRNGIRVNGKRVDRRELVDGDVIECGATMFVMRLAPGPIPDRLEPVGPTETLQTISPLFERELEILPKIARSRVPILVRGDSGTGKEVIARAVHQLSRRRGELVPVKCGAIPPTLIEGELFGSRRGAFSGAEDRIGLVRSADGGTLFLDEITELPPSSQTALLRVLQEGELLPLGSDRIISVDVRIVAASNRSIEELIADGQFRRDLYARLRGYELHLLPLRARIEDLGLLVAKLLERIDPRGKPRTLTRAAARALFLHRWPFHVRELEQALRAAIAVSEGSEIDVAALRLGAPAAAPAEPRIGERERLSSLLEKHAGNLSAIARELATSRTQISRMLERYGLNVDEYRRR